jgi:hypothetical protein
MIGSKTIHEMTVGEREEILTAVADTLEVSAMEAALEGRRSFAETSQNMAMAIRWSTEDLATGDLEAASAMLEQAMGMISVFRQDHPYPMQSFSIH